ncbi:hypothetical protein ACF0H5_023454 [Mactra antiquata]
MFLSIFQTGESTERRRIGILYSSVNAALPIDISKLAIDDDKASRNTYPQTEDGNDDTDTNTRAPPEGCELSPRTERYPRKLIDEAVMRWVDDSCP